MGTAEGILAGPAGRGREQWDRESSRGGPVNLAWTAPTNPHQHEWMAYLTMTETPVEYDASANPSNQTGVVQVDGFTRYARTPEWVLYHETLSDGAIRLYGVLERYGGRAFPSWARLAQECGKSERQIARLLRELTDAGALIITARRATGGQQTTSLYTLIWSNPLNREPHDKNVTPQHDKNVTPTPDKNVTHNDSKTNDTQKSSKNSSEQGGKPPHQAIFEAVWEEWTGHIWINGTKMSSTQRGKINDVVRQLRKMDESAEEFRARSAEYRRQHPDWEYTPHAVMGHWSTLEPREEERRWSEDVLAEEARRDAEEEARAKSGQLVADMHARMKAVREADENWKRTNGQ